MFRPCIDLHQGRVKQIVGASLRNDGAEPETNFVSQHPAAWYADRYRRDGLKGGHVIQLGPGNEAAAREALAAWPDGLQLGGGVRDDNAADWIAAGAAQVIVTSYVFHDGHVDWQRLARLVERVGPRRIVLDLSCRRIDGEYWVMADRWQTRTDFKLTRKSLVWLSLYASEFLVHAVDVEGKQQGVDLELVRFLGDVATIPATYAGGARSLDDMRAVWQAGQGRVGLTIGSALDLFGGPLAYDEVLALDRELEASG